MGLVKKILGAGAPARDRQKSSLGPTDYIDLGEIAEQGGFAEEAAATLVKVGEVHKFEDLQYYINYVYEGNMLILDFGPVMSDEFQLKRITSELRKLAADVGGDIAGIGTSTILVTPTGIKVDRKKVRVVAQ
ncbi:MAG TPA: cell division protein SepF [Candidatus Thermoplasmatota archaeon]|nr:cell division protein SepF [Candidatus Thermoplasmatota archaeon]